MKLDRQIVIRVDGELADSLKRDAEANGRSVAQTVRHILRRSLKGKP